MDILIYEKMGQGPEWNGNSNNIEVSLKMLRITAKNFVLKWMNTCKQLLVGDEKIGIQNWLRFLDFSRDKEHVDVQFLQIRVSMV